MEFSLAYVNIDQIHLIFVLLLLLFIIFVCVLMSYITIIVMGQTIK